MVSCTLVAVIGKSHQVCPFTTTILILTTDCDHHESNIGKSDRWQSPGVTVDFVIEISNHQVIQPIRIGEFIMRISK